MESWQKIIRLDKVNSTNSYFSDLLKARNFVEGSIVSALYQDSGKGQGSNTWESEKGKNILLSIVLYPVILPIDKHFLLSKAISLGIIDYASTKIADVKIKWPNDIYFEDNKLSGILIENVIKGSKINQSIVGIGLNLNQTNFTNDLPNPISLKQITNKNYLIEQEVIKLRNSIRFYYEMLMRKKYHEINCEYLKCLYRYNSLHEYKSNNKVFTAKITDVSELGYLQLETKENKKFEFDFKEVEFLI